MLGYTQESLLGIRQSVRPAGCPFPKSKPKHYGSPSLQRLTQTKKMHPETVLRGGVKGCLPLFEEGIVSFTEIFLEWRQILKVRCLLFNCHLKWEVFSLTLKGREFRIRNKTTYTGNGGSSVCGTKPKRRRKIM